MMKLLWLRPRRTSPANSRQQYAISRGRQQEVGTKMKHMCSWKCAIVFVVIYLVKLKRNQENNVILEQDGMGLRLDHQGA